MTKLKRLLILLLLLQTVLVPVSCVLTKINLDRNVTSGLWKLGLQDYTNLEDGKPDATLPANVEPNLPQNYNYSSFTFLKLIITAPQSKDRDCNAALSKWLSSVRLDGETKRVGADAVPTCVASTLSTAGFLGHWVNPNPNGIRKGVPNTWRHNPISIKFLLGGDATFRVLNFVPGRALGHVKPAEVLTKWIALYDTVNQDKITLEASVKNDAIMLLLDVLTIETINTTSFKSTPMSKILTKDTLGWKPKHFLVTEESIVSVRQKTPKYLNTVIVRKKVYPSISTASQVTSIPRKEIPSPAAEAKTTPSVTTSLPSTTTAKPTTSSSTTKPKIMSTTVTQGVPKRNANNSYGWNITIPGIHQQTTPIPRPVVQTVVSSPSPSIQVGSNSTTPVPANVTSLPPLHVFRYTEKITPASNIGWIPPPPPTKSRNSSVTRNATITTRKSAEPFPYGWNFKNTGIYQQTIQTQKPVPQTMVSSPSVQFGFGSQPTTPPPRFPLHYPGFQLKSTPASNIGWIAPGNSSVVRNATIAKNATKSTGWTRFSEQGRIEVFVGKQATSSKPTSLCPCHAVPTCNNICNCGHSGQVELADEPEKLMVLIAAAITIMPFNVGQL